ncbi:MAG: lyase family protein, partial [Planctomycetota bacterium]|nr:lyase family protein [Planctomycetota bacterium]
MCIRDSAVSDRDFALEYAFCLACLAIHMSRLASDLVLMATSEYGFVRLDDAFCTGSSIMPQKKNPDVLELIRGKCGRVIGALNSLMVMLKGLPLAYNRDMQEDKEPLFDASRQVIACLEVLAPLLRKTEFDEARMRDACGRGFMDATALAEYLAAIGVPFRRAHRIVGELVKLAESRGVELAGLSDDDLQRAHPLLGPDARKALGAAGAVRSYASPGSANPDFVRREVAAWRRRLSTPSAARPRRRALLGNRGAGRG